MLMGSLPLETMVRLHETCRLVALLPRLCTAIEVLLLEHWKVFVRKPRREAPAAPGAPLPQLDGVCGGAGDAEDPEQSPTYQPPGVGITRTARGGVYGVLPRLLGLTRFT
mgnify:CR=1 FL=1